MVTFDFGDIASTCFFDNFEVKRLLVNLPFHFGSDNWVRISPCFLALFAPPRGLSLSLSVGQVLNIQLVYKFFFGN